MKKTDKKQTERETFEFGTSAVTIDENFIYIKIDRRSYSGVTKYGNPKLSCPNMGKISLSDGTRYTVNCLVSESMDKPSIAKTKTVMSREEVLKLAKEKVKELSKS